MRSVRVRAVTHGCEKHNRRHAKDRFKAERNRRAGFSKARTGGVPSGRCVIGVLRTQHHPVRTIGDFYSDLPYKLKKRAVALSRAAGRMPRVDLVREIEALRRAAA